jgi:hypothetical protein
MRARAVLSITVLIAFAIIAPIVMHARGRDHAVDLISLDHDPDAPGTLEVLDISSFDIIQTYLIVDSTSMGSSCAAHTTPVLVSAPKTSPPLV